MKIILKLLVGFGAACFSFFVLLIAYANMIIVVTTADADKLSGYSGGLLIIAVALGIVFFTCISAKRIIDKM